MSTKITRQNALRQGRLRYFTGNPCKHGHVTYRLTCNRECIECARARDARCDKAQKAARTRASQQRNRAKRTLAARERYWRDAEKGRAYHQKHRSKNKLRYSQRAAQYRERHRIVLRERAYQRWVNNPDAVKRASAKWRINNRHKDAARAARRKCAKLRATPPWVNHEEIEFFYKSARRMTETTGVKHEVDHVLPLQGVGLRGLHVPWNLQILTKSVNSAKHNKLVDAALKE